MTNIWGFLVQTITVSLVAALLLVVKELLADKLSPRWQYGVWSVLALRILLPVFMGRNVLLPVPLWIETLKGMVERGLHSAYSAVYTPVSIRWPFPILETRPQSVTDWMLVAYAAGVVGSLAWYLLSYLRLLLVLHRSNPVSERVQAGIQSVCTRYGLRPCRAVAAAGLPSAFVCGVLRPVLVVPADTETDEKVLLHELLHLKYQDALQSVIWCILRSLHWCNPFLQFVFNRIGNDMESLCDQRVLERLEGEERREYGGILLAMANDRYPRAPGTTSVSNGGKNIARRIAAIVRFKKYPKGMGLVSVCVAVVLAVPVLAGTAASYSDNVCRPNAPSELDRAMAMTRIQRCATVAGALDTYAKGLMYENGIYIAMASPLSRHPELEAEMRHNSEVDDWVAYHLDSGYELEQISPSDGYTTYNLSLQKDGSYSAVLAFQVYGVLNPEETDNLLDENGERYGPSAVTVPVTVRQEDGWVVKEEGPRHIYAQIQVNELWHADTDDFSLKRYVQQGKTGMVTIDIQTVYEVDNQIPLRSWSIFSDAGFDETIKPNAEFSDCTKYKHTLYTFAGTDEQREVLTHVAMETAPLAYAEDEPGFTGRSNVGDTSWSSNGGPSGSGRTVTADWDGTLTDGNGGTAIMEDGLAVLPAGYAVRIYWNGEAVEDFIFGEVD